MSFQTFNSDLAAKVLFLANLQRTMMQNQNQNAENEKSTNGTSTSTGHQQQQHITHPLLMPSLGVSPQKISAMLAALTPLPPVSTTAIPIHPASSNNNSTSARTSSPVTSSTRSSGSSFGWGNRERKMEENWRMQGRST